MTAVTRHVEFEAAHLLQGYNGRCGSLHGHSYKLEVMVSCAENKRKMSDFGFVMDFKRLDAVLEDYIPDHCFITNISNEDGTADREIAKIVESNGMRLFKMVNEPSAENMVNLFARDLQIQLGPDFVVERLDLWETTGSHATWIAG